ncbi:MAG: 4Fe-4S dicluster domain-containing protein [Candidatus Ranarchaeia archaeon]
MTKIDLTIEIAGIKMRSPLIMSSSPITMDGKTIKRIAKYGAGAAVTKTILPEAAVNPRPCMAKVGNGMINCEGWSDLTPEDWLEREIAVAKQAGIPIIASVGARASVKGEKEKLVEIAQRATDAGASAIEIPAYDPQEMINWVPIVRKGTDLPVFGKFALWSFHIEPYIDAAVKAGTDAFTCIDSIGPALIVDVNTKNSVLGSTTGLGRISGPSIKPFALYSVYTAYKKYKNPILGCGGVSNAKDVIEFVMTGAVATQLCTAVMLRGPQLFEKINKDIRKWLEENNYSSLEDVRGVLHEKIRAREKQNQVVYSPRPPIFEKERCTSCGTCARVCPYAAITMVKADDGKEYPNIDPEICYGCGLCISACPVKPVKALLSPYEVVR